MDAHTASFGTGGTLCFQGTLGTGLFREMDQRTSNKGHLLLSRAADDLPFPVQDKGLFVKLFAFAHWPGFAVDRKLIATFAHQMAAQIGPIDVQFLYSDLLPLQVLADRWRDTGFRSIGWSEAHSTDETGIQVVQHMAFVAIHAH